MRQCGIFQCTEVPTNQNDEYHQDSSAAIIMEETMVAVTVLCRGQMA